jgi:4a-hydroxytetrahydrobiopterin dehydratase
MTLAEPLSDDEIERRLAQLTGWLRAGDEITKTFSHTYHECVHLAMYVAAKAREIGHHPDIDIRWQRIRFGTTTHDSGHRITELDFELARHIDAIAAGHGAKPFYDSSGGQTHLQIPPTA